MSTPAEIAALVFAALHIPFLLTALYNLFTAPEVLSANGHNEKVSLLIPARNEEKNISRTLDSILAITDPLHEIIILDDNSTDNTRRIAEQYSVKDKRIQVVSGKELPAGWLGKNFACHQLAKLSSGDYLLFADSDVTIKSDSVSYILGRMKELNLSAASVFPTQLMSARGEKFIVPMMNWILLNFLPLRFVYSRSNPAFVAANGQLFCFRRSDYFALGGHEAVKDRVVEDMELARLIKNKGKKMMTFTGGNQIFCTMYSSFSEGIQGFSKNFFPGFAIPAPLFLLFLFFLQIMYLAPLAGLLHTPLFIIPSVMIYIQRAAVSFVSRGAVAFNLIFHPVQILAVLFTGINSVRITLSRSAQWKGRKI
jgi:chlorobactene glucosyltransferase